MTIQSIFENRLAIAGLIGCVVFCVAVLSIPFLKLWQRVRASKNAASETGASPDLKPWLTRADWTAGKIKSSSDAQVKIFLLMGLAFCGIGGASAFFALKQELSKGNYLALLVLIFPVVGIGLLTAAARGFLAQRRYGNCFFEMTAIPGALGGTLEGLIQTGARLRLEHGLNLKLSCVRRTVSGSGKNRSVQENTLWQDEKIFNPHVDLPEPEPGRSGIPVYFNLPANQPECVSRGNEAVLWRLSAKTKMSGPDFFVTFDVPVFRVAGAVSKSNEADPTAALQMPVEEIRRDENSRIKITDGLHGREFYFPAARNPGLAFYITLLFLVCTGFTLGFVLLMKSILFGTIFAAVDVLIFFGCLNEWLKSSRITINPNGVRAVNHWLILRRTRRFAANDVRCFETKINMTSGDRVYRSIQLSLRGNKNVTLATGITSSPEADWLVEEMKKALGYRM